MTLNLGLPNQTVLQNYEIWDSYFTPAHSYPGPDGFSELFSQINRSMRAIELAKIQRLCYFPHVGTGTTSDQALERRLREEPAITLKPLKRWPEQLIGMIQLNASNLSASEDAIEQWIAEGPMVGVYFPGGGPGATCCQHNNFPRLVERIHRCGGLVMQHTWIKTGGKRSPNESTPSELVRLARQFPNQTFVCAHAGGNWELGIRAVADCNNILIETSGFDATAGFIEMATRELGAGRIVFGSHLPSRSLGTELGKILGAQISERDKTMILGANFRRILRPQNH